VLEPDNTREASLAAGEWRGFVSLFLKALIAGVALVYSFILLVDPYHVVPFSLPLERRIVSINQRYMYPQIVRSRRFDSLIVGTSTSRLLDPEQLDQSFGVRFANLAMDAAQAWEQRTVLDFFVKTVGPPKVLIVGLDSVWCDRGADEHRTTFRGFPLWLYEDSPWRSFLYLLNTGTVEIAGRLVGYWLGLYPERLRFDGYGVFVPPDSRYDPVRAHRAIWRGRLQEPPSDLPLRSAPEHPRFPALAWLDASLAELPPSSRTILAFMPAHVAAQPASDSVEATLEAQCKAEVVAIARKHGATLIDWRIRSSLTTDDSNYWDALHYRLPVATRLARDLGRAALDGQQAEDGSYRLLVR
jgi:hypothetical protein